MKQEQLQNKAFNFYKSNEFSLEKFQADFVMSKSRYPAFHAAWGTGKTLCLILRAVIYSDFIPNNLGLICRKEYNDLADSTIRDFQDYTGWKVDSKRNCDLPNGTRIMFRHLEEIMGDERSGQRNLQNINLGFAAIEQSDELATDRAFWLLWGRLRRKVNPTDQFFKFGLPLTSLWCIANVNGEDWNYNLWCKNPAADFALYEAVTHDNAKNLSKEFLDSLDVLRVKKPAIYARYVLNDRQAETDSRVFRNFKTLRNGGFEEYQEGFKYIGAFDPAKKKDYAAIAIYCVETKKVVYFTRWNKQTVCASESSYWEYTKDKVKAIDALYGKQVFWFMDATGVGDPVVEDLIRSGLEIYCDKEKETNGVIVTNNLKEQMVGRAQICVDESMITYPDPDKLDGAEKEIVLEFEDEMRQFKQEVTRARNVTYSAPEGGHDDLVFVFILCLWGAFGSVYDEKKVEKEQTPSDMFWNRVRRDLAINEPSYSKGAMGEDLIFEEDERVVSSEV